MEGKIKWYKKDKGYGFITADDDKDYFVHYTQLPEGVDNIDEKEVTFETKDTDRGLQAVNVVFKDAEEASEEATEEMEA